MTAAMELFAQAQDTQLNAAGTVIMTFSIVLVLGLNIFCMYRITRGDDSKNR